ncbi:MAG: hypothetical protein ABSH34_05275 [Verrucomicrobiota bacterium]|jgi:hypothetical protein
MKLELSKSWLVAVSAVVLAGCEGIPDVPYRSDTPAARIYGGPSSADASSERAAPRIAVPVVAGDADAARYLDFSDVRVNVEEKNGQKRVRVYTDLTPKEIVWRVSFIKDGQEVYHFNTSSRIDYINVAIPLEPLALDPNLPVPDKVVVTRVEELRK